MTVQKIQGIVEAVSVKALPAPDKYENLFKHALKVGDVWYDFGGSKMDSFSVKDDEGKWKRLGKGSEVLIKFEQNGNFNNSKKTWLTVLNLVEGDRAPASTSASSASTPRPATQGAATPSTAPVARSTGSSSGPDWGRKDAGAAASASIDKAILALAYAGELADGINMDRIKDLARTMQDAVVELAEEIYAKNHPAPKAAAPAPAAPKAPAKPTPAAKKTAAPAPTTEPSWEDEEVEETPFD